MDEDNSPQSNNNDVSGNQNGDEPEFSSSEKVFDITSDLNIKPVNDVTAAEEAKEKDVPIPNFAEKIAAQTKNARIYREGDAQKQTTPSANLNESKNNNDNSSNRFASQKTESNPFAGKGGVFATNGPIGSAPEEIKTVPPEIAQKYHTSTIVETKPWVKNKPTTQSPVIDTNIIPEQKSPDADKNNGPEKPSVNTSKIPLQDIDPILKVAKTKPINSFVRDRSNISSDGRNEITGTNPGKIESDDISGIKKEEETSKWGGALKPMRTYEGDVAELLSKKRPSTTTIAIAESKRNDGEESLRNSENRESSHAGKKLIMILLSLIMIGAGVTGAYYLYMKSPLAPVTPITNEPKISSIVPNDAQALVAIDRLGPLEIQYKIQNEVSTQQETSTIKEIVLTETVNEVKNRVSGPRAIDLIDIDMPDILKRSLDNDWMLGIYTDSNGEKDVFVVLTNNFFQNAFAGMLQWESVMADDIKQYLLPVTPLGIANIPDLGIEIPRIINPLDNLESILPVSIDTGTTSTTTASTSLPKNASGTTTNKLISTTTATSTTTTTEQYTSIRQNFTIRGNFEDRIVRNKDVRAFRTSEGNILFLYSFIDNKKLIITTKESTLNEVLLRIEKEAFVR